MLRTMAKKAKPKKDTAAAKPAKPKTSRIEPVTHIDRSNGQFLKRSQLNKDKPWLGPVSGQASVEVLTDYEKENLGE